MNVNLWPDASDDMQLTGIIFVMTWTLFQNSFGIFLHWNIAIMTKRDLCCHQVGWTKQMNNIDRTVLMKQISSTFWIICFQKEGHYK